MEAGRSYLAEFKVANLAPFISKVSLVDRLQFDAATLDVKSLRTIVGQATQKGLSGTRLLLITTVDSLSDVMQNTLLKILEEPPKDLIIILQTNDSSKILPTVLSRLHTLKPEKSDVILTPKEQIDPREVAALTDRHEIIDNLRNILLSLRADLLEKPSHTVQVKIELVNDTVWRLQRNTNLKLTMDRFLLHWPN